MQNNIEVKNWNSFYEIFKFTSRLLHNVIEKKAFYLDKNIINLDYKKLNLEETQYLKGCESLQETNIFCTYILAKLYHQGPIIFRPEVQLVEFLEDIEVNFNLNEWTQPFDTIIVELPSDFKQRTIVDVFFKHDIPHNLPVLGMGLGKHCPVFAVLHWDKDNECLMILVVFSSTQMVVEIFRNSNKPEFNTIEDMLDFENKNIFKGGQYSKEEAIVSKNACRIALNAVQYIMENSFKTYPQNEIFFKRLNRYVDVAKRDKKDIEGAKFNVKMHPRVITIKNRTSPEYEIGKSGKILSPHIRRGHYQHYWIGSGSEKKKVRKLKKPQKINWHLLKENSEYPQVIYRYKINNEETQ